MNAAVIQPNPWMILPFIILLLLIAVAPLVAEKWWTRHCTKAVIALALVTLAYYLFGLRAGLRVAEEAKTYISFIALVGSLYVVSGGIHINVKGEATPLVNVTFLLVGAALANVLGTTGASMLLIRPWIRMNQYRVTAYHIVFFIFIVANVGGVLTPIGDPPLLLGYLYGIPFWWLTKQCLPMWAMGVGLLLLVFYVLDRRNFTRAPREVRIRETGREQWRFDGLFNLVFLSIVLGAVFIRRPLFLREALMVGAALGSYFTTAKPVHEANHFDFHPLKEVAVLFIGIFATMMPAMDWLAGNARSLVGDNPGVGLFYWGTGALSGVLDNAPTYASSLSAIVGTFIDPDIIAQVQHLIQSGGADLANVTGPHAESIRNTFLALERCYGTGAIRNVSTRQIEICFLLGNIAFSQYITAISVSAVFFGASTYIGNGPNFMVKAIATHRKIQVPTFFGYIFRFTLPFLLPILTLVWWVFFRN